MVKQSLPDMFYYWMILATMALSLTGTAWSLAIIAVVNKDRLSGDGPLLRYAAPILGLVSSAVVVIVLLVQYGLHDTIVGLNEQVEVTSLGGNAMWATFVIHIVTIPVMLGFMVWYYFHPIKDVPGDK